MSGDPTIWVTEELPMPNMIEYTNRGAILAWQIDGFFATHKGIEYLNDTIGKITLALRDGNPNRLPYKPDPKTADHYLPKIYKLKAFAGMRSVSKKHAPTRADSYEDHAFWAIKLYTEDLIREFEEGTPVPYSMIEDWAIDQFIDKERSTIRAKCRSIWNWNDARDWILPKSKRRFQMTRSERAIKNSAEKADRAKKKIISAITGMFADEYKKKNGKWNVAYLANELDMSRNTVSKYLSQDNID